MAGLKWSENIMKSTRLLLVVCLVAILSSAVLGVTVLPGTRAPLLDTPATPSTFRSGMSVTSNGGLSHDVRRSKSWREA